jgi:hypothetical protein
MDPMQKTRDEEITEEMNENGPPCKHCGHACLDHDDKFGHCTYLGTYGVEREPNCECPGYEEVEE